MCLLNGRGMPTACEHALWIVDVFLQVILCLTRKTGFEPKQILLSLFDLVFCPLITTSHTSGREGKLHTHGHNSPSGSWWVILRMKVARTTILSSVTRRRGQLHVSGQEEDLEVMFEAQNIQVDL